MSLFHLGSSMKLMMVRRALESLETISHQSRSEVSVEKFITVP